MLDTTRAYGLTFLFPEKDAVVGPNLRDFGEFARVEVDLIGDYLAHLKPGTFIDVGANIGSVCLPVAKRFPDHWTIAVEGHGGLAQLLSTNAFANGLYRVEVLHAVAGAEAKIARFPSVRLWTEGNFGSLSLASADQDVRTANVRMLTLDEIAPDDTRFVKVDVEGFEPSVLAGAQRVLKKIRPVWLLETAIGLEAAARDTIRIMLDADYDVYWLYTHFVNRAVKKSTGRPRPKEGDHNIVCVPKGGPNLWSLQPVLSPQDEFPRSIRLMPYLARYGFSHEDWAKQP